MLNRRKFELKQKYIHLRGGNGDLLEVHLCLYSEGILPEKRKGARVS